MNSSKDVDAYIAAAPADLQATLEWLRARIRRALPRCTEGIQSKMPVYDDGGRWVSGFAWRKKGVMFYCMNAAVLDEFEARLGKARSGKSCVAMRDELKPVVQAILDRMKQLTPG